MVRNAHAWQRTYTGSSMTDVSPYRMLTFRSSSSFHFEACVEHFATLPREAELIAKEVAQGLCSLHLLS